jgi:hypothetical protein
VTKSVNLLFQALAVLVQYGNQASGIVPQKYQTFVMLAVGLAQAAVSWHAHSLNPDGTPATVAYVPPAK